MKTFRSLALASLLLPLLLACSPAADTASAPASSAADTAATATAAATASAPSTSPHAALQGNAPVAGTDYEVIQGGAPLAPADGRIEVVEIFSYTCVHCFRFQSLLGPWKAALPADVNFIYLPAAFGGPGDQLARAALAAQGMGAFDTTHEAVYSAIQEQGKLAGLETAQITAMYAALGVDAGQLASSMDSFGTTAQLARANQFALRSGITGTPTLIVAGKYRVIGNSFEDMLRITEHLIARERAALAG